MNNKINTTTSTFYTNPVFRFITVSTKLLLAGMLAFISSAYLIIFVLLPAFCSDFLNPSTLEIGGLEPVCRIYQYKLGWFLFIFAIGLWFMAISILIDKLMLLVIFKKYQLILWLMFWLTIILMFSWLINISCGSRNRKVIFEVRKNVGGRSCWHLPRWKLLEYKISKNL